MNIRTLMSVLAGLGLSLAATADTIVEVTESKTLSAADVSADTRFEISSGAVLTLAVDQDLTCKGATGSGMLVKTGSAQLEFTNPESGNQVDGEVTIEIQAGRLKFTEANLGTATVVIGSDGALDNYGWPTLNGTLTVENATAKTIFTNSGYNSSLLIGNGSFVKTGEGELTVNSSFSISGSIRVDAGILSLNRVTTRDRGTLAGISGEGSYKLRYAGLDEVIPANHPLVNYLHFNGDETDRGLKPLSASGQSSTDTSRYEATDRGKAVQLIEAGSMTAMYGENATLTDSDFAILARAKTQKQDKTVIFSFGQRSGGAIGFGTDANGQVRFAAWKDGAITASSAYAAVSGPTDRYHFYAATYDSTAKEVRFYADGQLVGEPVPYTLALAGNQFQLGAIYGGTDASDSVKSTETYLDELRVYGASLSAEEIATFAEKYPVWPSGNTWTNAAEDSDWSNTANWSYGQLPAAGDEIIVEIAADTALTVPSGLEVASLTVEGSGTLSFANANLAFAQAKIGQGVTVVYPVNEDKSLTTTLSGKGTFKKTGSAQLALNNGSTGRIADGGVTIEIAEGKILCNNGHNDPAFGDVKFVLGDDESVALENFGWMDFYGTMTFSSTSEKSVFNNNNYQGTGGNANIRQSGKIVKEGSGTVILKSRVNQAATPIEVKEGKFLLSVGSGMDYTWSGSISGTGRFGKTGPGTLTVSADQGFRGGVEIAEGELVLAGPNESTTYGIYGSGTLVNGSAVLQLAYNSDGYSLVDATVKLTSGEAKLGVNGVADGAKIKNGTFVLDGGTFTGWGWPTFESVTVDCRQNTTVFNDTNGGHSIMAGGKIVKKGSSALTFNAHLRSCTVTIEDGSFALSSDRRFYDDKTGISLAGLAASFVADANQDNFSVDLSTELSKKYRVVKTTDAEGDTTYTLEKRGGFAVIIM